MRSAVLFLVAAGFAAVCAQEAPCTPPQKTWEAIIVEVDRDRGFEVFSKLSYDGDNERVRDIEAIVTQDRRVYYGNIYLHAQKMHYRIQYENEQPVACTKEVIDYPFRAFEPPRDSKYFGSAVIGTNSFEGAGVEVKNYGGEVDRDGEIARYIGTWTAKDCLPVHDGFISQKTGFVNVDFFDVTLGIPDVNVFNPPAICFQ